MCPVCGMLQHPANRTHNPQRTISFTIKTNLFHLVGLLFPRMKFIGFKFDNFELDVVKSLGTARPIVNF